MSLTRLVAIHGKIFFSITERCEFQFVKYKPDPEMVSESTLNKKSGNVPELRGTLNSAGISPLAFP